MSSSQARQMLDSANCGQPNRGPAETPHGQVSRPRAATRSSERALGTTAFFLADVADGLGPFLVIELTSRRGWTAAQAGLAMAVLLVGTVCSQTFIGAWIDRTRHKTWAISVACCIIGAAVLTVCYATSAPLIYSSQVMIGIMVSVFPPALAALSLGLVGRHRLPARAGRNEACFHAGNVCAAGVAMAANFLWGASGIFWGVAMMAVASAVSARWIDESRVDYELARGADDGDGPSIVPWRAILLDRRIQNFVMAVVLFHFANAAMLPLVGQKVAKTNERTAQSMMALCIIIAQVVMVPVALLASRLCTRSRRAVFLVGFGVLPMRGLLYTITDAPRWLMANQVLDGIGAGIFGVAAVLMMADLTRGTGRFNFAQGLMATAIGLGAAASQCVTGMLVDQFGYNAGFYFLSAVAGLALTVFYLAVPDTLPLPGKETLANQSRASDVTATAGAADG